MRTFVYAITAWIVFAPTWVTAHDMYNGLENPVTKKNCCNGRDCKVVPREEVTEDAEFYYWQGASFYKAQRLISPDKNFHVCAVPARSYENGMEHTVWTIRCLLAPFDGY